MSLLECYKFVCLIGRALLKFMWLCSRYCDLCVRVVFAFCACGVIVDYMVVPRSFVLSLCCCVLVFLFLYHVSRVISFLYFGSCKFTHAEFSQSCAAYLLWLCVRFIVLL